MKKFIIELMKQCFHFVPAIVMFIIYELIPAIPFVKVSSLAYIFVFALFVAGVLLSSKLYIGVIVGIISTILATITSFISLGRFDTRTVIFCIVFCVYYLYCAGEISEDKKKARHTKMHRK